MGTAQHYVLAVSIARVAGMTLLVVGCIASLLLIPAGFLLAVVAFAAGRNAVAWLILLLPFVLLLGFALVLRVAKRNSKVAIGAVLLLMPIAIFSTPYIIRIIFGLPHITDFIKSIAWWALGMIFITVLLYYAFVNISLLYYAFVNISRHIILGAHYVILVIIGLLVSIGAVIVISVGVFRAIY